MSTATDSTTSPPDKNSLTVLRDFSDRLSPIVVKELRQGLRQPSFVILFLFLQSVLAMAVITSLFAVSSASLSERVQTGNVISGFFFGLFALSVLIIQPLRGLNALSSEIKQKTIDLLLLTKLSAWRIVFGKWLCLNTQSALLLVAILPYLMMRYFLGGMNILSELGGILAMFLVSGVFCAAGVGLSAVRSIILRTIFAILGVIALITMLQGSVFLFAFSRGPFISGSVSTLMSGSDWTLIITGSVLLAIYLTISFLEFGATRIAPPSENRSTRKRLLALIALFVIPTLFALPEVDSFYMSFIAIVIITALALADALSENPQHVRPMGENSFWMLRPGWPSGALFGLMLLAANIFWLFVLFGLLDSSRGFDSNGQKVVAQLVGTGLLIVSQPALIIALFRPYSREPANLYLASLLGSVALGMVILMINSTMRGSGNLCDMFFPLFPSLGLGTLEDESFGKAFVMFLTAGIYLASAAILGYNRWKPVVVTKSPVTNPPA